ncbi:MAG: terminase gpA endonuclease subunit [Candidatus Sedimenticola sp. (ex Thyasira tokunagai)]
MTAPPQRTPDKWADGNRILPQGSAEPGQWRSSRNPYMIPIARAFVIPQAWRVTFVMGSQMGKSASIFNVVGHRLEDDPAPVIYIGPTQSNIDNVIEPKITDMLQSVPGLWNLTAKGKKNTKHHKRVAGVSLRLAWAGSPTEMASDSAALALVDELDRMDQDVGGEGSPVELADARTSTYPDGKVGITSTPTEGEVETYEHPLTGLHHWDASDSIGSPVWRYWQEGSRHEWAVPCPDCLDYFIPRFSLLTWKERATAAEAEKTATLACPCCGSLIATQHRTWMNARGVMVAPGQKPSAYDESVANGAHITNTTTDVTEFVEFGDFVIPEECNGNLTFWVSGLMSFSAKKTFGYIAGKFVRAVGSGEQERVQAVLNTDCGELFRVIGEAPKWQAVMDCAIGYSLEDVPEEVTALTCGVDVQKNRLVYVVRGWAKGLTSWLIDRGELWGETDLPDVWEQLEELLRQEYGGIPISRIAVDSGYRSNEVYTFCRAHKGLAIPTKGHDTLDKPYKASSIDVNVKGKIVKKSIQLWHFNADIFKSWVHSRVGWPQDQTGAWFLPSDIDEDYCRQIVAEQRVTKASGKVVWVKTAKDNHFLDAEALAYLAIRQLGRVPGRKVSTRNENQQSAPRAARRARFRF